MGFLDWPINRSIDAQNRSRTKIATILSEARSGALCKISLVSGKRATIADMFPPLHQLIVGSNKKDSASGSDPLPSFGTFFAGESSDIPIDEIGFQL
jgi:hypothetical protein